MIDLRLGQWQEALADVGECDSVICDPPYSERTHSGHDEAVASTRLDGEEARIRIDRRNGNTYSVGVNRRRAIDYPPISDADAIALVAAWAPRVRGWICLLTDHVLAPVFSEALEEAGRYVFAPVPCVDPGSRVRLAGDGPSSWVCWLVVSRPATREWAAWGTLPGAYLRERRPMERPRIVGGKPLWLMQDIVRDYTRPGDLVVDPFAGSGTTAIACHRLGRSCITCEQDPDTYSLARARIDRELAQRDMLLEEP